MKVPALGPRTTVSPVRNPATGEMEQIKSVSPGQGYSSSETYAFAQDNETAPPAGVFNNQTKVEGRADSRDNQIINYGLMMGRMLPMNLALAG